MRTRPNHNATQTSTANEGCLEGATDGGHPAGAADGGSSTIVVARLALVALRVPITMVAQRATVALWALMPMVAWWARVALWALTPMVAQRVRATFL